MDLTKLVDRKTLDEEGVTYVYARVPTSWKAPTIGWTFAFLWRGGTLIVGVARCSKQDQFSKEIGRRVAGTRALDFAKGVNITEPAVVMFTESDPVVLLYKMKGKTTRILRREWEAMVTVIAAGIATGRWEQNLRVKQGRPVEFKTESRAGSPPLSI